MVFVEVDKQGRVVLPKKLREAAGSTRFEVELEENRLVFVPVKKATEMFGTLKDFDMDKFRRNHNRER